MSLTTNAPAITTQTAVVTASGNVSQMYILNIVLTPVAVATATTAEQSFAVPGLLLGDFVMLNKPTAQAGLGISNERVSANGTLSITYANNSAGAITPTASESYNFMLFRPIAMQMANGMPSLLPLLGN